MEQVVFVVLPIIIDEQKKTHIFLCQMFVEQKKFLLVPKEQKRDVEN